MPGLTTTAAEARRALGLTRAAFSDALGVHTETLAKWERGQRKPDNAAQQSMCHLVWLHQHHPRVLARMLTEI